MTKSFFQRQLNKGKKVEMEHTRNPMFARKIALDHLKESTYYYIELHKMERRLKRRKR